MEYGEKFLVADDRFSSHQAGLMLHMGLKSLNVTYPTSSPETKNQKYNVWQNSPVAYLTLISKEIPNINFF